jgi:hypothetical protein
MYFVTISLVCLTVFRGSKYFIATWSVLSSLGFLNIFVNMYLFAGGITLVIAALILRLLERPGANDDATPRSHGVT